MLHAKYTGSERSKQHLSDSSAVCNISCEILNACDVWWLLLMSLLRLLIYVCLLSTVAYFFSDFCVKTFC